MSNQEMIEARVKDAYAAFKAAGAAFQDARRALYLARIQVSPFQQGSVVRAKLGHLRGVGPGPWHPAKVVDLVPQDEYMQFKVVPLKTDGNWSGVPRLVNDFDVMAVPE